MTVPGPQPWVADPGITWRILLTGDLGAPVDLDALHRAAADLTTGQGWAPAAVVVAEDVAALRTDLGSRSGTALAVGVAGTWIVVAAHHSLVDGLGLLAVMAALTGSPVSSAARGVGDRPASDGFAGTVARRLTEVAFAPPAPVAADGGGTGRATGTDVHADLSVAGTHTTPDLVTAAVRAVTAHNVARGVRTRHVAVAVGVARTAAEGEPIRDRSALLRLRDVEALSRDDVAAALRTVAVQPAAGSGVAGGAAIRAGLRLLAPRLGSTLLVSHLGDVSAPGLAGLAFYPVTAGGSGLSLGGLTHRNRTVLTLRGRARDGQHDGLEHLLEAVAAQLG